jgi:hypothetical protein
VNMAISVGFGLITLHALYFLYSDLKLVLTAGTSSGSED